ncbi:head-tail connector protein [Oscillibacter sp.]|uniref:head-tail connector protein n=1 Tax=Oscillibacter sp. TaxID=1945593 RepID=UPI00339A70FE
MAELTDARRVALLAYCRIDAPLDDGEKAMVDGFYFSAMSYMEQAGVSEPEAGTNRRAQYDLCVNYLVLDSYQRRDVSINGAVVENTAFRRLLNQLKLTEPVPDLGTGTGTEVV